MRQLLSLPRENAERLRKKLGLFRRWVANRLGGADAVDAPYIDIGPNEVEAYVVHWNYPEEADSFLLRHRNLLHCSLLVVGRAQVA
jgi:hypothetical protein